MIEIPTASMIATVLHRRVRQPWDTLRPLKLADEGDDIRGPTEVACMKMTNQKKGIDERKRPSRSFIRGGAWVQKATLPRRSAIIMVTPPGCLGIAKRGGLPSRPSPRPEAMFPPSIRLAWPLRTSDRVRFDRRRLSPTRWNGLVLAAFFAASVHESSFAQPPSSKPASALPSENQLPGPPSSAVPLPTENQLPDAPPKSAAAPKTLPPETQLPTPLDSAEDDSDDGDAEAEQRSDGEPLGRGELRPIFRLDYNAHTARINDLIAVPDRVDPVATPKAVDPVATPKAVDPVATPKAADPAATPNGVWTGDSDDDDAPMPRFVSAGDDKNALVWSWNDAAASPLRHRRTLRWQVWRGPRGRIYRVAANDRFIAMAGHGAMGGLGEIILYDAENGDFLRPLLGNNVHRQVVAGLDFGAGTPVRLASRDVEGRLVVWTRDDNTGLFEHQTLVGGDREVHGAETAKRLLAMRDFVPVSMRDANEVWYADPVIEKRDDAPEPVLKWFLHRRRIDREKLERLGTGADAQTPLSDRPTLISLSDDGRVAAVAVNDRLMWWKADRTDRFSFHGEANVGGKIAAIAFSDDGNNTFVLTDIAGKFQGKNVSRLQRYAVGNRGAKLIAETLPEGSGSALAVHGNRIVAAMFADLRTYRWDERGIVASDEQPRSAATGPKSGVRFTKTEDQTYRVMIAGSGNHPVEHFDLSDVRMLDTPPIGNAAAAANGRAGVIPDVLRPSGRLTVRIRNRNGVNEPLLYDGDRMLMPLPIDLRRHGSVQCFRSWEGGSGRQYMAVGTDGRNNVYVYRHQPDAGVAPQLVRQFRGHMATVRGIDVSADARYLATAAEDATVMIWNLDDIDNATTMANRWGIQCDVQDGVCVIDEVREDGPLYFRGIRRGDAIESIGWVDSQQQARSTANPQSIMQRLLDLPFDALVKIEFSRSGVPQPAIQSFWAFGPLASLMVDRDREWAMWTPAGFYDASFNGHTRVGWQINRGVQQEPDYFRAAQMQQRLERPDVMRRLLDAGSLPAAMRSVYASSATLPGETALVQQATTKPVIHWVSPKADRMLSERVTPVTFAVDIASGLDTAPPQVSVAGVSATDVRILSDNEATAASANSDLPACDSTCRRRWYQASLHVPTQTDLEAQVWAATRSGASSRLTVPLRAALPPPTRRPRMRILAVGVSQYEDPQISDLDFAADAAGQVAGTMAEACGSLYDVTFEVLTNGDGVRPLYRVLLEDAVANLREDVLPDDVLILYLCGHGLRDRRTGRWYFVTADADYRRLMADQYAECLSTDDFGAVRELPCRKLAILDSCHSGAVQMDLRDDDLKSALRFFQRGSVLTLTASEGDQEAAEDRGRRLGRFTAAVIDSLSPQADADGDGLVQLDEWADSVVDRVRTESRAAGSPQYPTRSPARLFRETRLPLMQVPRPVANANSPTFMPPRVPKRLR